MENNKALIECRDLSEFFPVGHKQVLKAVNHIDLDVFRGETLGLVGESGCGKSTLGRVLSRIYQPSSGTYLYDGRDVTHLRGRESLAFCKKVQMVFQDPYASLNPRMTVSNIIGEGIDIHKMYTG
ncbi:MAG: ATP-binding cassette domain-containing protein, partial [Eubacteriales bacterium]|nr:ATP-binding cassette domain-containing protein [Eubacteriales bacterium]